MLRIVEVSDYREFEDHRDEWEGLLSKSKVENVFLTYDWIDACIRHFCKNERLCILNVFNGDTLVGIAPLTIKRYRYFGLPVRSVCFIGTDISDRMDFILDGDKESVMTLILDYLIGMKEEWDIMDFQEIAGYTENIEIIEGWLKKNRIINITGPAKKSFFIGFNGEKERLSQRFSKKFSRKLKKLNIEKVRSNLEFKRYTDGDIKAEELFSDVAGIEDRSWKGKDKAGIFSKKDTREFHKEIFDRFAKNKWMDISILSLDRKPIAYVYNYLYGKKSYNYNIAFDKAYAGLSAGTMLIYWVLKDSMGRDISEFDFARGEGSWKTRLTQSFRIHNRVRIFKDTFYLRCLHCLQKEIMPCLRKNRILHSAWMAIKGRLGWD